MQSVFTVDRFLFDGQKELEKSQVVDDTKSTTVETKKEEVEEEQQLAQLINNEYSLEEIIYQLARILFSHSLHQGTPARQSLR